MSAADPPDEQPLVSLVLLAYNQEDYVTAAIEGALAQDYTNLEIILSDDRSADSTFEIIEAVARDYTGPHRVRLNRTPSNNGILGHLYNAVGVAQGELIVAAAGDDISMPNRVSALVKRWRESGADGLSSGWSVIDSAGRLLQPGGAPQRAAVEPADYFPSPGFTKIFGVTSAYARSVFSSIRLPDFPILTEDFFFTLMLSLQGRRIEYIAEPLVLYRVHAGALTHRGGGPVDYALEERKNQRLSGYAVLLLRYFDSCTAEGAGAAKVDLTALRSDIGFLEFQARWIEAPVLDRIRAARRARTWPQVKWILPRLFGVNFLVAQKRARDFFRDAIVSKLLRRG